MRFLCHFIPHNWTHITDIIVGYNEFEQPMTSGLWQCQRCKELSVGLGALFKLQNINRTLATKQEVKTMTVNIGLEELLTLAHAAKQAGTESKFIDLFIEYANNALTEQLILSQCNCGTKEYDNSTGGCPIHGTNKFGS